MFFYSNEKMLWICLLLVAEFKYFNMPDKTHLKNFSDHMCDSLSMFMTYLCMLVTLYRVCDFCEGF